jgi:hypothetical protein
MMLFQKKKSDASELTYGGLEGKKSRPNDHRSSSRYISDPTGKGGQDTGKTGGKTEAAKNRDAEALEMALPVTEDDYLQPQTSSAYLDVVSDNVTGRTAFRLFIQRCVNQTFNEYYLLKV